MERPDTRVKVAPLPPEEASIPPPRLVQFYLNTYGRLARDEDVSMHELDNVTGSTSSARQVGHNWVKHGLAVRLRFGEYALVDPSIAIRAWGVPRYYADLLRLHDVLHARKIPHAFACLTGARNADYVPEAPLLVTYRDEERVSDHLDSIRFDFRKGGIETVKLDVLGLDVAVPALDKEQAALIFAALGTPREVAVARALVSQSDVSEEMARRLNHFGLRAKPGTFRAEDPRIVLTDELRKRRERLADSMLAEGMR